MMLMQMKNTERLSLTLQRATFLGSANVRPTPQMKDKKENNMVLLHASGAVPTNPKPKPTSPTTVACSIERPAPAQEDTATGVPSL